MTWKVVVRGFAALATGKLPSHLCVIELVTVLACKRPNCHQFGYFAIPPSGGEADSNPSRSTESQERNQDCNKSRPGKANGRNVD